MKPKYNLKPNHTIALIFIFVTVSTITCTTLISNIGNKSEKPQLEEKNLKDALTMVLPIIEEGWARFDTQLYNVYVDPMWWSILPISLKQNYTFAFAIYIAIEKNNLDVVTAEVYDDMSGKKLAKYGVWGFTVY